VILAEPGAPITDDLLSDHIVQEAGVDGAAPGALQNRTDDFEREQITAVLTRVGGVKARAAEELGLTYRGLTKKMRRLGMELRGESARGVRRFVLSNWRTPLALSPLRPRPLKLCSGRRQDHAERRAAADGALDGDVAAVLAHHLVDERESEAGARLLGRVERVEDVIERLRGDARPLVGDLDDRTPGVAVHGHGDVGARLARLDGVQDQIQSDLLQLIGV